MLKDGFILDARTRGIATASDSRAKEAIDFAESKLAEFEAAQAEKALYPEREYCYASDCASNFEAVIRKLETFDPVIVNEFAYAQVGMHKSKEYLRENLITALTLYSDLFLGSIQHNKYPVMLIDDNEDTPDRLATDEMLSIKPGCFTFFGFISYLVASCICRTVGRPDEGYRTAIQCLLNKSKIFQGTDVDTFLNVTRSIKPEPFERQGIRGELPSILSYLVIDTIRHFSDIYKGDKGVKDKYKYKISAKQELQSSILLNDYVERMIDPAQSIVHLVKALMPNYI